MADCELKEINLGTLSAAMREITDDIPDEGDAKLLAEALGCLPIEAYMHIVEEVRRNLVDVADRGAQRALEQASESNTQANWDQTVGAKRAEPLGLTYYPTARLALFLQALIWTVLPFEKDHGEGLEA